MNTGVSTYDVNNDRFYERGTSSHNCLCIEDKNTSEIWSSFRVGRRAKVDRAIVSRSINEIMITCSHTGYLRSPFNTLHTRRFIKTENAIEICDSLSGERSFKTQRYLHLHPDINIERVSNNEVYLNGKDCLKVKLATNDANTNIEIFDSYYSRTFYSKVASKSIKLVSKASCPVELSFKISW